MTGSHTARYASIGRGLRRDLRTDARGIPDSDRDSWFHGLIHEGREEQNSQQQDHEDLFLVFFASLR
jgi:hypothetical protein